MTTYLPRSAWGAVPPARHPGTLDPQAVVGLAFHWPAMAQPKRTREQVALALRSWQRYHMGTMGWSDIAYQIAVDQAGRAWYLRGLGSRSAANGGTTVNGTFGALLLVLAPGEEPSDAMIATVREVVADHRRLFPRSDRLVGHGAIRPGGGTECPGPAVRAHLARGTFEPTQEDDMPTPEDVAKAVWNSELATPGASDPMRAKWLLSQAHNRAGIAAQGVADLGADMAQLARMVKALPGATPDIERLADEIAQRTAAKVAEIQQAFTAADVAAQLEVKVKEE